MIELKTLSKEAVPAALERAEKYRLLNHPGEAESICRDVLQVEPENQKAIDLLLLALTDQFHRGLEDRVKAARELLPRIKDEYRRAYRTAIIHERQAKAELRRGAPGSGPLVYESLREAMRWYEKAQAIRPPGNDEAVLRWNACARTIMKHEHLEPGQEDTFVPLLE